MNRKNCCLDSFNHQVTAGWVALSSGRKGFLLAENAESLTSMAFCPMRLREKNGLQQVMLNPFGSYFGRQLDYSHLGGSGTGAALTQAVSGALHPNGPSFNGQHLSFSLLVAPYAWDMPPQQLQRQARSFFYPPGVIYRSSPLASEALLAEDVWQKVAAMRREEALRLAEPLLPPCDFLANPADGAVDLVWEEPGDVRIDGYELRWQENGTLEWRSQKIATGNRWQVTGLANGKGYGFQVRSIAGDACSEWTKTVRAMPGRVAGVNLLETIPEISPRVVLNLAIEGVKARLKVNRFRRQRQEK